MIGQYLSNNNENATVAFCQKFWHPNGAQVNLHRAPLLQGLDCIESRWMTARRPGKVGRCSPSPSDAAEMQMLSPTHPTRFEWRQTFQRVSKDHTCLSVSKKKLYRGMFSSQKILQKITVSDCSIFRCYLVISV
jgi:hypothetical protein